MLTSPGRRFCQGLETAACLAMLVLVVLFFNPWEPFEAEKWPGTEVKGPMTNRSIALGKAVPLGRAAEEPLARSEALRRHVKDACRTLDFKTSKNLSTAILKHLLYDDEHKVIYCYIPKVACTSWKRVFLKLAGKPEGRDVDTLTRYEVHYVGMPLLPLLSSSKNHEEKLRTFKKFMFVRHPFVRALSAFRDKLERSKDFQKVVGQKIEKKYRGTTAAGGRNITFREFIRYISEQGPNIPQQRNEHWLPMHELCDPCSVDYDFIGTKENLHEDADYVLKWLGVADLVGSFPGSSFPVNASRHVSEYLQQLTNSEIVAFYTKYLSDYLLFDYEFL